MQPFNYFLGVTFSSLIVLSVVAPAVVSAADSAQESIVLDPTTGDYTLTYCCDDDGNIAVAVFEPSTKVDPQITSSLEELKDGPIEYRFTVSISDERQRPLQAIYIDHVSSVPGADLLASQGYELPVDQIQEIEKTAEKSLSIPDGWLGFVHPNHEEGLRIGWSRRDRLDAQYGEFAPGTSQKGFGFMSADLPDVSIVKFMSKRLSVRAYPGEGPDPDSEVGKALRKLEENDFVPRFAAVPAIEVPNPFDCALVLERIRDRIKSWPAQHLMDSDFNATMVNLLDDALSACRNSGPGNSQASAIRYLNEIRKELRKGYPGLEAEGTGPTQGESASQHDQRLAARVLDFDVTYVFNRLSGK